VVDPLSLVNPVLCEDCLEVILPGEPFVAEPQTRAGVPQGVIHYHENECPEAARRLINLPVDLVLELCECACALLVRVGAERRSSGGEYFDAGGHDDALWARFRELRGQVALREVHHA
jgi:hypothetical protein